MSRYQILIADPLLNMGLQFPEGVFLAGQLEQGPAGMHWHLLDDPGAPAELEGRQVELTLRRVDGKPVIASRRVILTHLVPEGDDGQMPCCGQPVLGMPHADRITTEPDLVTCGGE